MYIKKQIIEKLLDQVPEEGCGLLSLSQRFEVAKMLRERKTYLEIAEKTGASTATISRVNRSLNYGSDGYELIFKRLGKIDGQPIAYFHVGQGTGLQLKTQSQQKMQLTLPYCCEDILTIKMFLGMVQETPTILGLSFDFEICLNF